MPSEPFHPHVLVVAPSADLRHSLAFMLTAEGFAVSECAAWPPEAGASGCDALIIDHAGLDRRLAGDARLVALGPKTIILASQAMPFPTLRQATIIRKPLLEGVVVDTLRQALAEP